MNTYDDDRKRKMDSMKKAYNQGATARPAAPKKPQPGAQQRASANNPQSIRDRMGQMTAPRRKEAGTGNGERVQNAAKQLQDRMKQLQQQGQQGQQGQGSPEVDQERQEYYRKAVSDKLQQVDKHRSRMNELLGVRGDAQQGSSSAKAPRPGMPNQRRALQPEQPLPTTRPNPGEVTRPVQPPVTDARGGGMRNLPYRGEPGEMWQEPYHGEQGEMWGGPQGRDQYQQEKQYHDRRRQLEQQAQAQPMPNPGYQRPVQPPAPVSNGDPVDLQHQISSYELQNQQQDQYQQNQQSQAGQQEDQYIEQLLRMLMERRGR